jgi:hypothetical protein
MVAFINRTEETNIYKLPGLQEMGYHEKYFEENIIFGVEKLF